MRVGDGATCGDHVFYEGDPAAPDILSFYRAARAIGFCLFTDKGGWKPRFQRNRGDKRNPAEFQTSKDFGSGGSREAMAFASSLKRTGFPSKRYLSK
ncbi:hypothetical protein ACQY1H_20445 [Agrobacterium vitis]